MQVYVKSFRSWVTTLQATSLSYNLVKDSLSAENSSISIFGTAIGNANAGDWIIADRQVYSLLSVKQQDAATSLSIVSPLEVFSRKIEIPAILPDTIGALIAQLLTDNWIDEADPQYAVPYLTVSDSDTTPLILPETDNNGLFSLSDYARLMRKVAGVVTEFSPTESGILCSIHQAPSEYQQISFSDGRSQIVSASFSSSGQAKLTAIQDLTTGEKDAEGNPVTIRERSIWYLAEDGSISQSVPDRRAKGSWGTLYVSAKASVAEKVAEAFAKNKSTHKLEFYSLIDLPVGAECLFYVEGEEIRSQIAHKSIQSGDGRYFYRGGELATTATEKLKGV